MPKRAAEVTFWVKNEPTAVGWREYSRAGGKVNQGGDEKRGAHESPTFYMRVTSVNFLSVPSTVACANRIAITRANRIADRVSARDRSNAK